MGNILKAQGIKPVPMRERTGSWETFLNADWDVMASIDFTTVEVWTKGGLTTFYLLFVMELKTCRVKFAGCTTNPNEAWMKAIALELTNHEDGFLKEKKYLIMDRNATFSKSFRACLRRESVNPVRLAPRSPNLNAHLETFFGSLKSECLHKLILFGGTATRRSVTHYHTERNHQGLENDFIVPMVRLPDMDAEIETTERLGGLLRSYRRAASLGRFSFSFPNRSRANRLGYCCAVRPFCPNFSPPTIKPAWISTQNSDSVPDATLEIIGQRCSFEFFWPHRVLCSLRTQSIWITWPAKNE